MTKQVVEPVLGKKIKNVPGLKKKRVQRLFTRKDESMYPHARWLNRKIRSNKWGKERTALLKYTKANGEQVERKVKPIGARGSVLIAHDYHRNAVRSFRLDRIQHMEKSAFFAGFEKGAKEALTPEQNKSLLSFMAAGAVGSGHVGDIITAASSKAGDLIDRKAVSMDDVKRVTKEFIRWGRETNTPIAQDVSVIAGATPSYNPITRVVRSDPRVSSVAHELGHSVGGKLRRLDALSRLMMKKPLTRKIVAAIPSAGAASESDAAFNALLAAPLALSAPTLLEEGRASLHGLRRIRAALGSKAALKSIPSLAASLGTYAGLPVGAAGMGYLVRRARKKILEDKDERK